MRKIPANGKNGKGFNPIGGSNSAFNGSLDGNNHSLAGLHINRTTDGVVGLIVYNKGTIKNLKNQNISFSGSVVVGGLVGSNNGSISNVTVTGVVSGKNRVGGLVGYNYEASIENVRATTTVNGSTAVGGLVGMNGGGTIRNVTATGTVNGLNLAGGIVGLNRGSLHKKAVIRNATATGNINGSTTVGGLVGVNGGINYHGVIQIATASGDVTGSKRVGGLVGSNSKLGLISNATAKGTVNASDNAVGGLVGKNNDSIIDTFALGSVTGASNVGGLVGLSDGGGAVEDSYWNTQTTNQVTSAGNAIGLTTAQMTGQAAKTNMTGLNFESVWQTQPDSYPILTFSSIPNTSDDNNGESNSDDSSGQFNITNVSYPEEATVNDFVSLNATIRNEGNQTATDTVTFVLGDATTTTILTLKGGEQNILPVSLPAPTSGSAAKFNISTSGDSVTGTIQLSKPNSSQVAIRNVTIDPMTINTGFSQIHTLSFTVHNVSSDGQQDEFTISLPQKVSIESIPSVTTNRTDELAYDSNNNDIEFNVNPNTTKSSINYRISLRMRLSAANRQNTSNQSVQIETVVGQAATEENKIDWLNASIRLGTESEPVNLSRVSFNLTINGTTHIISGTTSEAVEFYYIQGQDDAGSVNETVLQSQEDLIVAGFDLREIDDLKPVDEGTRIHFTAETPSGNQSYEQLFAPRRILSGESYIL